MVEVDVLQTLALYGEWACDGHALRNDSSAVGGNELVVLERCEVEGCRACPSESDRVQMVLRSSVRTAWTGCVPHE